MNEEKEHFAEHAEAPTGRAHSGHGHSKQKIRIRYRQRVKIKKRPRGYSIQKFWKKHRKNIVAYFILAMLLGATCYLVFEVAKQRIELNQQQHRQRL